MRRFSQSMKKTPWILSRQWTINKNSRKSKSTTNPLVKVLSIMKRDNQTIKPVKKKSRTWFDFPRPSRQVVARSWSTASMTMMKLALVRYTGVKLPWRRCPKSNACRSGLTMKSRSLKKWPTISACSKMTPRKWSYICNGSKRWLKRKWRNARSLFPPLS